ncbi:MAG: acetyl-CoA hydrolase/transferase family protein [Flavobacteriales bacterium]|nr:acetyl-CoA hydrolase/transferase family protein [Flavobacteriales bacterium]
MKKMEKRYVSPAEAVQIVKSGDRVFIHSAAATPTVLLQALTDRAAELRDVELLSIHTEGPSPYAEDQYADSFKINTFFVGPNIREYVNSGRASYIPVFLSEIPRLFKTGLKRLDVALVTVSPPNKKGYCSLGCNVDVSNAAIDNAHYVIAVVNPQMPRVHGNGIIHIDKIHAMVKHDAPLYTLDPKPPTDVEQRIGQYISELVEDGATLQMGIGGIPNAAIANLTGHKNLGVHTEMFSDGLVELVERGVVTGMNKVTDTGKIVTSFVFGTRKVYDFVDENPIVEFRDADYVNDVRVIRQNPKVTAINSALEVDVFGQVCADSIGTKQYSGVGGQMDFVRGASLSDGGKPIIALPSRTRKGISRIVPMLKTGADVTTTRAHVHYIVTEFGVAYLYGKNLQERAKAMIEIAHPQDRESLEKAVWQQYHLKQR